MSRAVYTFAAKIGKNIVDSIEFELLDNPGVRAWQYAVLLNSPNRTCFLKSPISYLGPLVADIGQKFQDLKNIIAQLSNTDYAWKGILPETFDQIDHNILNILHRHFTGCCYDLWDYRSKNFEDDHLNKILQNLNLIVHDLELCVPTNAKLRYGNLGNEICMLVSGDECGYDMLPFRQCHSYEPADLILDPYILGKTLIESFAGEDQPSNWDTNGHMKTNGGAIVLLDNQRTKIYNSEEFATWLDGHGLEPNTKFADFPLGHFVAGHRDKLEHLVKDLHNYSVQLHIQ